MGNHGVLGSASGKSFDDRSGGEDEHDDSFIMNPIAVNVAVNVSRHVDTRDIGESAYIASKHDRLAEDDEDKRSNLPNLRSADVTNLHLPV